MNEILNLNVRLFKTIEMTDGQNIVSQTQNNSKKMWNLLSYLLVYHDKVITENELINVLWYAEDMRNSHNALKTLVYRLRKQLEINNFPSAKKMIVVKNNSYAINKKFILNFDFVRFEQLVKLIIEQDGELTEIFDKMEEAFSLYQGRFLESLCYEQWVLPLSAYYHGLFLKLVDKAVQILKDLNRAADVIQLCKRAIAIDPMVESFYYNQVEAYIEIGDKSSALEQYENAVNLFYDQYGINISAQFKKLYREIANKENDFEFDLDVIKEQLNDADKKEGAFVCEYEFFKDIYKLESRVLERTGQLIFLGLLTLTDYENHFLKGKNLSNNMQYLLEIIIKKLRKSDVVSRFSPSQYVLLLPTHTYDNGLSVMKRIISGFKHEHPRSKAKIHYALQPLTSLQLARKENSNDSSYH